MLSVSACGASSTPAAADNNSSSSADQGTWPRTVKHDAGETTIPKKPLKIVSTSLTLTGTLLAIEAPITATAATTPSSITDDKGFFSQWAKVADDRKVQVLYPKLTLNIEDVIKAETDLIVGSTVGADSTKDQYDQLSKIAPTVMFNYGNKSWEDLASALGVATGHESDAKKTVSEFDTFVTEQAKKLKLPEQPVNALLYQRWPVRLGLQDKQRARSLADRFGLQSRAG
ncbi:ferric enterobactin transporter [Renibacterium salmoninarum ATCC 33209]|uniref:Ferric enterobactin transporter n=1 Tax=Renibacterium salmoninarum (strain ATCC 33209 / DSM 20767 / JCM 11484 / NBRC 15589 / NCIMB 2235) TaxID=288705 RepID=A9WV40_RENSM|nr:Fe2+-enterobactin ABC transporter substrate-binding protein [Renibacterium salmoninarum]ABY25061.1 ferric enterobactin transporter [Renibacterium salmoninarum ATCC 33209]